MIVVQLTLHKLHFHFATNSWYLLSKPETSISSNFRSLATDFQSVSRMSQDFTTNLLESIRKSEATTLEKQRKIQECAEAIEQLSVSGQASENACRNLKQEIEDAKDRTALKKAEKDLSLMKLDVAEGQVGVLEAEARKTKAKAMEIAEEMTALVDNVSSEAQVFIGEGEEVIGKVRQDQNVQLISELQLAEEAYKQNGQLDKVIQEVISVDGELRQGGEALASVKDLRDTLKAEAKDLMEKVHSLNTMKNDGGDSVAVGQVRELQLEISELEQEVKCTSMFSFIVVFISVHR